MAKWHTFKEYNNCTAAMIIWPSYRKCVSDLPREYNLFHEPHNHQRRCAGGYTKERSYGGWPFISFVCHFFCMQLKNLNLTYSHCMGILRVLYKYARLWRLCNTSVRIFRRIAFFVQVNFMVEMFTVQCVGLPDRLYY